MDDLALRFAAIVDSSHDVIISTDVEGIITTWNAAATQLLGYTAEELIGQSTLLIVPPELYEEEWSNFERVRAGARIEHCQTQRLRKGGSRVDISLSMSPIRGADGELIGAALIARDALPERQSDDARLRLSAIVESSDDAIISKDLNGIVTSWNRAAERVFGYTADEMIGRSIVVLIPPELQYEEVDILQRLRSGERIEHYETRRIKKGGEVIDVLLTISPVRDSQGRVIGASKIARDISDSRRSNETTMLLAAIVESSDDAIIGKNLDGVITSWNAGATSIFGYEAHEIVGHSVLRLIPRELHGEEPMIMARLRAGQRIEHYESVRVTKNREFIDVSLTISPIRDASGKVIGASKIARDITRQKRAEASLVEKEKLTATARLAATIAHEVNNPLEAIMNIGFLLASDSSLPPQARSYAELLLRETQRASEITKRTLTFCRSTVAPAEVHIPKLLGSILTSKTKQMAEKGIQVTTEVKGSGFAFGMAGELGQVFSNLIENAIDALGHGGRLRIRTRDLYSDEGHICISICDDGTGISRQDVTRIFEPFFTTKTKGTGLGLWVSRDIIHKHGGDLRVRSNNSPHRHGTIFTVILPSAKAIAATPPKSIAAD